MWPAFARKVWGYWTSKIFSSAPPLVDCVLGDRPQRAELKVVLDRGVQLLSVECADLLRIEEEVEVALEELREAVDSLHTEGVLPADTDAQHRLLLRVHHLRHQQDRGASIHRLGIVDVEDQEGPLGQGSPNGQEGSPGSLVGGKGCLLPGVAAIYLVEAARGMSGVLSPINAV